MKTRLVCAGFVLMALNLMAAPFSDLSFDAALQQAAQTHKIVLIDFYTTWCGPCNLMDKRTWTDTDVIKLLEQKTVALRLDAEKETNLANRFKIEAYPTILLVRPDGTELDRLVGYRDPKMFTSDFGAALNGRDSVTRAKEKLTTGGTNDPMLRMQYAQSLAQKGKDAEALAEYLWCFDYGAEVSPSFIGVRLSFLLNEIEVLGKHYPPAEKALENRRDGRQAKILSGTADSKTMYDLVRLNEVLGQSGNTLALFDRLPTESPARHIMAGMIVDQLLAAKRYGDILSGGDPQAVFAQQVEMINYMMDTLNSNNPTTEMYKKSYRKSTVDTGTHYFEALAGLERNEEGKQLAQQILKFDPSAATHATLAEAAERAGNTELAQFLKQ
jgi:thiol-disulfide isomerase/thioredoxin